MNELIKVGNSWKAREAIMELKTTAEGEKWKETRVCKLL